MSKNTSQTRRVDIDRKRAKYGYEKVSSVKGKDFAENYKSYVRNLPTMIKTNGLGTAIAFVFAKKNGKESKITNAYKTIYEHIETWLKEEGYITKNDLMNEIINMDTIKYKQTTIEVIEILTWLKRFSEGLIEGTVTE